jgi:hypothetical protein
MLYNRVPSGHVRGFTSLTLVLFVSLVATIALAAVQSRLMLGIYRMRATQDATVTDYAAESFINDLVRRIMGNYAVPDSIPEFTLPDGITKLAMTSDTVGDTTTYEIVADREFSTRKIQAIHSSTTTSSIDKIQLVFGLDCTTTMGLDSGDHLHTRFEKMEEALLHFIDTISSDPAYSEVKDRLYLGLSVFSLNNKWMTTALGTTIDPNLKFAENVSTIRYAVVSGFGRDIANSPVCQNLLSSTSVGSPFSDAHRFYRDNPETDVKRFEVVITDGDTNARQQDPGCPPPPYSTGDTFCPGYNGYSATDPYASGFTCTATPVRWTNPGGWSCGCTSTSDCTNKCFSLGRDYLRCALAPNDGSNDWQSEIDNSMHPGIRDPEVNAYGVLVYNSPPPNIVDIYTRYLGDDHFYSAQYATELPNILIDILDTIKVTTGSIIIRPTI